MAVCLTVGLVYANRDMITDQLRPYLQPSASADAKASTESSTRSRPTEAQIQAFVRQFQAACEDSSLRQLDDLHYWEGHSDQDRTFDLERLDQARQNMVVNKARYLTLAEAQGELPDVWLRSLSRRFTYNGIVKTPNLRPIGLLNAPSFMPKPGLPTGGYFLPVGLTPQGELKIVSLNQSGSPRVTPKPALTLKPRFRPVSTVKSNAFTQQLKEAFDHNDERLFLALFELRGGTQDEINKNAEMFARYQLLGKLELKDVDYMLFPDGGQVALEGRYFNLPIVGVATITIENQTSQENFPLQLMLGMNEDGEIKVPMLEPKK